VHVVAARCGHDPAVLLRAYAKRTRKADTAAADVISTLSAGILGGKEIGSNLGRNSIPFRFGSTLAIRNNWLNLMSYLLLLTRLILQLAPGWRTGANCDRYPRGDRRLGEAGTDVENIQSMPMGCRSAFRLRKPR
jgi:hypothetical protein